jgi:hypothetical protein
MPFSVNQYWPVQRLYVLEDGNDHETLRNFKNGICEVILLNVADIPDSLPGLTQAQTQRGRQVKVLKCYDGKGLEVVCHPQGGRML